MEVEAAADVQARLWFPVRVQARQPDPVYAHKLQELIGGAYGEMTVAMQYLFQGWNCRMPGQYKDLIMDVATEEMGHVEMIATMVARLLEGAPATATTKAALAGPVVGAVLGGIDPQQAIVAGGAAAGRQQWVPVERPVHRGQREPAG